MVENGRILQDNLRKTSITMDELTGHLRQKEVLDIRAVQYAILETDGNLSVFLYPKDRPASATDAGIQAKPQYLPITIVEDGYLFRENLTLAGKDENWVRQILHAKGSSLENTWLLTVDAADHICFYAKEVRP